MQKTALNLKVVLRGNPEPHLVFVRVSGSDDSQPSFVFCTCLDKLVVILALLVKIFLRFQKTQVSFCYTVLFCASQPYSISLSISVLNNNSESAVTCQMKPGVDSSSYIDAYSANRCSVEGCSTERSPTQCASKSVVAVVFSFFFSL